MKLQLAFFTELLGSGIANPDLHSEYIAGKAKTPEDAKAETAAIARATKQEREDLAEEKFEKAMTVFPRTKDGHLHLWDYQVKGFFKETLGVLIEVGEPCVKDLSKWLHKRAVDSMIFITPREIPLLDARGQKISKANRFTRPLQAETMQGPRVALATSEVLPAGTCVQFSMELFENSNAKSKMKITPDALEACLNYGALKGFGQWRSGGFGRFTFAEIDDIEGFTPPAAHKEAKELAAA